MRNASINLYKNLGLKKSLLVAKNLLFREIDLKLKRTHLLSSPMALQIEPTTKCNLKCRFCISSVWDRRGIDMDLETFKKIIDQFPYLSTLLLQGVGEPFLNKDFFKMVEYCKKKHIFVRTTTNGKLLNEKICKKIVESGLDVLIISIEGTEQKFYDIYKYGLNFNKLIESIKLLNQIKAGNKPDIKFNVVATSENIRELPKIIELAKELGVWNIEAGDLIFWGSDDLKGNLEKERLDKIELKEVVEILNEAKRLSNDYKINFYWKGVGSEQNFDKHGMRRSQNHCLQVFRNCFITADCFITYCDMVVDPRIYGMGSLKEEKFKDIWNNERYITLRKQYLSGDIPEECKVCGLPKV